MKRMMTLLLAMMMAVLSCGFALAEESGSIDMFDAAYMEEYGLCDSSGIRLYFNDVDWDGTTCYAYLTDRAVYTCQPGEEPQKLCTLPDLPENFHEYEGELSNEQIAQLYETVTYITAYQGTLYGYNVYSGGWGVIDEGGIHWKDNQLNFSCLFHVERFYPDLVLRSFMMDGMLATLVYVQDDDGYFYCAVETFDLASGESRQYPIEGLCGACRGAQGELICLLTDEDYMNYSLCRINVFTGETSDIDIPVNIETTAMDSLGGLAYSEADNALFVCANGRVYRSLNGGDFEAYALVQTTAMTSNARGWVLSDSRYVTLCDGLHIRTESQETANELVFAGYGTAMWAYEEKHPEIIQIRRESINGDKLIEALMRQDDTVDIYVVEADYTFENIKKQGYAASLSSSALIKNDVSQMYEEIQSVICDENGNVVAYPAGMSFWINKINLGYWHMLWPDRPEPTTFDELLDAWIDWEENLADEYPGVTFNVSGFDYEYFVKAMIQAYARQHEDGEFLDLDTPELRSVLEKLKKIRDIRVSNGRGYHGESDPGLSEAGESGYGFIYWLTTADAMRDSTYTYDNPTSDDYLYGVLKAELTVMPLTFEKDAQQHTEGGMSVYFINPYARHKADAMQFLEELVQDMTLGTFMGDRTYYAIHPNENDPLEDPEYEENRVFRAGLRDQYKKAMEEAQAKGEDAEELEAQYKFYDDWLSNDEGRWLVHEKEIRAYRDMLNQSPLSFSSKSPYIGTNYNGVSDTVAVLESACERYAEDSITLDAFLQEVTSKVKMIYMENQ